MSLPKPVVFISHSTQDRTIAGLVCQALERQHIPCWIAPRDVPLGHNAFEAIPQGLSQSRVLVLILSSTASRSDYVQRELQLAVSQKKIIIPLRIEDIQLDGAVDFLLTGVQWLDAFVPPVERHVDALVRRVTGVIQADVAAEIEPAGGVESARVAAGRFEPAGGSDTFAAMKPVRPKLGGGMAVGAAVLLFALIAGVFGYFIVAKNRAVPVATTPPATQPPGVSAPVPVVPGVAPSSAPANSSAAPHTSSARAPQLQPMPKSEKPFATPPPRSQGDEATPEQLRARAAVLTAQQKMRDQDFVAAENYFRLAVNLDPENAAARSGLAAARRQLGEAP